MGRTHDLITGMPAALVWLLICITIVPCVMELTNTVG